MNRQTLVFTRKLQGVLQTGMRLLKEYQQKQRMRRQAKWFAETYGDTIKKLAKE
jgi:hypothetical protein